MLRCIYLTFVIILSSITLFSQIDSLKRIVDSLPDEEKAAVYNQIFFRTGYGTFTDSTLFYAEQARYYAEKTGDDENLAFAYRNIGTYYSGISQFSESIVNLSKALAILKKGENTRRTVIIYQELGEVLISNRQYDKAADLLFEAQEYCDSTSYNQGIVRINMVLGRMYRHLAEYDKATNYLKIALEIEEKKEKPNQQNIIQILKLLGLIHYNKGEYEEAIQYFNLGLQNEFINRIPRDLMIFNNSLALVYKEMDEFENAIKYYKIALKHAEEANAPDLIAVAHMNIGQVYAENAIYPKAIKEVEKGLAIANEYGYKKWQKNGYENLFLIYDKLEDVPKAYFNFKKFKELEDSLNFNDNKFKIAELETKYATEKKEKQIQLLNQENEINSLKLRQNRRALITVAILTLIIIISGISYFRQLRKRQKAEAIIKKQLNEKRLLSTVISTENKERKRFAEDLHDGLGPLLSSVKLYLSGLEEAKQDEKKEMILYTQELIDESIKAVRTISNNILPEELSEKGLIPSLKSFCNKLQYTKKIAVEIIDETGNQRLESSTEVILYRVIQELINNTIKHAEAKQIILQFSNLDDGLKINYQDDGQGFILKDKMLENASGLGLKNIHERLTSLDGELNFSSSPGKGTQVNILLHSLN